MTSTSQVRPSGTSRIGAAAVRLRVETEIHLWRRGWIWVVTVALLLAAGGTTLLRDLAIAGELAQLDEERAALDALRQAAIDRRAAAIRATDRSGYTRAATDRQAALAAVLVSRDQTEGQVRRLYELAEEEQIAIMQAEFHTEADASGIHRLQVSTPVKARYPALRRFLERCLREFPNASLDRLTFRRNQVGEAEVEARIHVSLWMSAGDAIAEGRWATLKQAEAKP